MWANATRGYQKKETIVVEKVVLVHTSGILPFRVRSRPPGKSQRADFEPLLKTHTNWLWKQLWRRSDIALTDRRKNAQTTIRKWWSDSIFHLLPDHIQTDH